MFESLLNNNKQEATVEKNVFTIGINEVFK